VTYPSVPAGAERHYASQVAPSYAATGLTGATAAARFAGGTTSGSPSSGAFAKGDAVVDQTGSLWICTAAGSPGTWVQVTAGNVAGTVSIANGGTGQTSAAAALQALGAIGLQATAGANGYTLVNGTGNIVSWTAPNDGNKHRVIVFAGLSVTSLLTGGACKIAFTLGGEAGLFTLFAGGEGIAAYQPASADSIIVDPDTAVTVEQTSVLSSGAGTVWAEIWGS